MSYEFNGMTFEVKKDLWGISGSRLSEEECELDGILKFIPKNSKGERCLKKETRKRRPPFPIIKFFISISSDNRERGVARRAGQRLVQRATSVPREGQIQWPSREWWKGVLFCWFLFFSYSFSFGRGRLLSSCNEQRLLSSSRAGISLWWPLSLQSVGSRARGHPGLCCRGSGAPWHMEGSWTRGGTCVPCIGRWILLHWTTGDVQVYRLINVGEKIKHASSYFFHQKFWNFWEGQRNKWLQWEVWGVTTAKF